MRKGLFLKTLALVRLVHYDYVHGKGTWDASINDMADWVRSVDESHFVHLCSSLRLNHSPTSFCLHTHPS